MKYLTSLLFAMSLLFVACNKNDEPPTETLLSVAEAYLPATCVFDSDDSEWIEKIKGWSDKKIVVNSLSELPNDPLGFSDAYRGINFDEYTLLITYNIHDWDIETYRNRYYKDNVENTFNWAICIKTVDLPDDSSKQLYFTRYAILVRKLPENANLKIWFSIGLLNWDRDKD